MRKTLRKIAFLLCVGLLGATSFGMSYFYFENARSETKSIDNGNFKIDDIEENYRFGQTTDDTEYTIYFFPSAAYLYLYGEYLENDDVSIKPEEQFGYKEVQFNETGNVLLDDNGNTVYELSENKGKYVGTKIDGSSTSYEEITYDGAYRKFIGEYFSCSNFEADGGYAYNGDGAYMQSQNALTTTKKRTWGVPNEDFTIFPSNNDRIELYNGRNQYSSDRLGCWDDCYYYGQTIADSNDDNAPTGLIEGDYPSLDTLDKTNTGRFLPIKITIKNSLSANIMEKAVGNIFTSMGNSKDYHDYSFTQWTYVKDPDNSSREYPYSKNKNTNAYGENTIGEAFQPIPRDTYFDMFSDLSSYADSDNVIRLFPLFSDGKKLSGGATYLTGGGAAERLQISYENGDAAYKYPLFNSDTYNNASADSEDKFTYTKDGTVNETCLENRYIRLFSYNNLKITSSTGISSLTFSACNLSGYYYPTEGNWQEVWRDLYTVSDIQSSLINKYGEGLYTFYVFIANYSYRQDSGSWTEYKESGSKFENDFDNFCDNVISQASEGGEMTSLNKKHLIKIGIESPSMGSYKCSPTVVAFEKIDEPKVINDFPTENLDSSRVSAYISKKYELADGFSRNSNSLYEGEKTDESYSVIGSDISSDNPYTYIARNVDFMNDDSSYFFLSFSDTYSTSPKFSLQTKYEYLISSPTIDSEGTYVADPDNVFSRASEFVSLETISGSDGNEYEVFKFKEGYIGIYDILIQYNEDESAYDVYMFRHSNLFCYLFDGKLDDYEEGKFVNHNFDSSYEITTSNGNTVKLLFEKKYFLGQSLSSNDLSTTANKGNSFETCFRNAIKTKEGSSYEDSLLLSYVVKDRITDAVVAKYTLKDGTYELECNQKIYKNYIFYIEKIA